MAPLIRLLMNRSYLEDIVPKISYRPSNNQRGGARQTPEQVEAFRKYFEASGNSSEDIDTLAILSRADRIDFPVRI